MTKAHVFLIDGKDELVQMPEAPYPLEGDLQEILARHPDLLPGDQIDPENPRRWLLVGREIGVPAAEDEAGWWSLDHLFLDQSGIPTFVECKRAVNTQSRRQVVAQMLDYAANGTAYWSVDKLRARASDTAEGLGMPLDQAVDELLGPDAEVDAEGFWDHVADNLRSGRVRLLFVLDHAPRELRRLVEFLNDKTKDVELAVVEVKRFARGGTQVMVPRVLGLTEAAIDQKADPIPKKRLNRGSLLDACDPVKRQLFDEILSEAEARGWDVYWATTSCSLRAPVAPDQRLASLVYLYPENDFVLYFSHLSLDEKKTQELRSEFQKMGNMNFAGDYTLKREVTADTVADLRRVFEHMTAKVQAWTDSGKVE